MKSHPALAIVWLTALSLPIFADTFTMKDGSTVEGSILREDATSYVVEVQVTKSIKDERVIAKADVASIKAEKPYEAAFDSIKGLFPTPDGLNHEDYAQMIRKVEKFLTDYRGSLKTTDAKKILADLKDEANEILAGGVKLNGKIISAPEYRANAYDIDSRIEAAKIQSLIDKANYIEALRAYERFDDDFHNTTARQELTPLVMRVIRTYVTSIGQSLSTFTARTKARQVGLERMPAGERASTAKAIAEENVAIEKRFNAEKVAKLGWVTTHPFYKPSLEATVNFGKMELKRLETASSAATVDAGKAYRDALTQIQNGGSDTAAVTAAIAAAKSAKVAQRYIDALESAANSSAH